MMPLPYLVRNSDILRDVVLEVRRHDTEYSTWHPMLPGDGTKWLFPTPVELMPGEQVLTFWQDSQIIFLREVTVPDRKWIVTSFWPQPCDDELDQPTPGCRIYTSSLEAFRSDPDAIE